MFQQCDPASVPTAGGVGRRSDPGAVPEGVSSGDFSEALQAILGEGAPGLSAANVVRLKAGWEQEYQQWTRRDLSGKRYVYVWADGST